jgi:hypothetical protein
MGNGQTGWFHSISTLLLDSKLNYETKKNKIKENYGREKAKIQSLYTLNISIILENPVLLDFPFAFVV